MQTIGLRIEHLEKRDNYVETRTIVSLGEPGKGFITSKGLAERLAQRGFKPGDKFGHVRSKYEPETKTLQIITYYPLTQQHHKYFEGFGIAALTDRSIVRQVRKKFGEIRRVEDLLPNEARRRQLRKRGHTSRESVLGMSIYSYLRGIRRKTSNKKNLTKRR